MYSLLLAVIFIFGLTSPSRAVVSAPVLLWKYKGPCFNSWCHRGWYSSPVITKINGQPAVIGGFYAFAAVLGSNGSQIWSNDFTSGGQRMWPGIVLADMDGNGVDELVTGHGGGRVGVWNLATGTAWTANWPITLGTNEWRSVAVADLDGDGKKEIAIGKAIGANLNAWVLQNDGTIRPGWPLGYNTTRDGYTWGVYNNNIGITNMDADAKLEVIVPSDVTYVCAYNEDGTALPIGAGVKSPAKQQAWGLVQFATDRQYEVLGYVDCSNYPTIDPSRTNFADGPVTIADLDGDGTEELVFVGRTYKFCIGSEQTTHNGVYVMNKDRTRWATATYNWTVVPDNVNTPSLGDPLSMDYTVIESATYNPVVADLDGDGKKEILFSSYDGKIHVFWLDKTEKWNWPYVVGTTGTKKFATEPIVVDIDNDGKAEVIVSVWGSVGSKDWGTLLILDYKGTLLHSIALPIPKSCDFDPVGCTQTWSGALASPTVGNLNADSDLEIALVTTDAGIVAYTIPNSAKARVLWGTSRGGYSRTGNVEQIVTPGPAPTPGVTPTPTPGVTPTPGITPTPTPGVTPTPTPGVTPTPTPGSAQESGTNVGAIVGGVIGGLFALLCIGGLLAYLLHFQHQGADDI